jgi:dolichol-phosphate mannosyltransferase
MKKIAIIIPLFNEEESIPQLFNKLKILETQISQKYSCHFIFVDDGSRDNTFLFLTKESQQLRSSEILKHKKNQNLGAALKTGIHGAKDVDYLAFLDSDCTYEPVIIAELLNQLENGYDLATVSPYHPLGVIDGVPPWRLLLSKGLSLIYQLLLNSPFFTYTAMVRAVRMDRISLLLNPKNDFTFVAIFFIKAIHNNLKIVEIPAKLSVRQFGFSKMSILKTIKSHLKIILSLLQGRKI